MDAKDQLFPLVSAIRVACQALVIWAAMSSASVFAAAQNRDLRIAVSSNFTETLHSIVESFQSDEKFPILISSASTAKLYTQIKHGAPFDVFLAADQAHIDRLIEEKLAIPSSRISYAIGQLVLYAAAPTALKPGPDLLRKGNFRRLAMTQPNLAPYGAAARATLEHLSLTKHLQGRIVQGKNVNQTFQFAATGHAELGFVALSQLQSSSSARKGEYWLVPDDHYPALIQDAVILNRAKDNPTAKRFIEYLQSPAAKKIMKRFAYRIPGEED
ncbi:MAG: molybdate ABC transporter substrate-binding protein [Oligoflexus sp.]